MTDPAYRHRSEIGFAETDASGWMHFPNAFIHFERAEHAYLRSKGILVFDRSSGGWPRVHASCDYRHPLITGESIEVLLWISRIGSSSVTWKFSIINSAGQTCAEGTVTTVRVDGTGKPQPLSVEERNTLGG
jgi:acyl-CoA thioester hydrolase